MYFLNSNTMMMIYLSASSSSFASLFKRWFRWYGNTHSIRMLAIISFANAEFWYEWKIETLQKKRTFAWNKQLICADRFFMYSHTQLDKKQEEEEVPKTFSAFEICEIGNTLWLELNSSKFHGQNVIHAVLSFVAIFCYFFCLFVIVCVYFAHVLWFFALEENERIDTKKRQCVVCSFIW